MWYNVHIILTTQLYFSFYIERTVSSDKLSISTSVDALYVQSTLTYDEAADICLADDQTKIKLLNDKLAAVSSSEWTTA